MNVSHRQSPEQVSFVVYLPMKPEQKERGRSMVLDVINAMSREPEFVNAWVHESQDHPDTVVIYETWNCSRDEFIMNQLSKLYRAAYEAALPEILSAERQLVFLTPLAAFPTRQS
jgi:quinol monooxygenase YgiN